MTLGDVYVNRDGTIRFEGEPIGYVFKHEPGTWRAEIGSAAFLEAWPPYGVAYAKTRKAAVASVLEDIEVPV
jgi:hypothetical protein